MGIKMIGVLDGGRKEVVVNSCFEGLQGRMGLKKAKRLPFVNLTNPTNSL